MHVCFVNSDWEDTRMATIIVARRHNNKNYTIGLYLTDLLCQGVKDTSWYFNVSAPEYESIIENISSRQDLAPISYVLAHNIIYGAYEFALDCGLDSHPDFISTTSFILDEDSEEIELIDIEFGEDGVPVFVNSPGQSQSQISSILLRLDNTLGPGNYKVVIGNGFGSDLDDDEYDENIDEDSIEPDNEDGIIKG